MAGKSLYEIMGVPESATGEAVKAAYAAGGAKLEGQSAEAAAAARLALNEAFRILSSEQLRRAYDNKLAAARAPAIAVPVEDQSWLATYGRSVSVVVVLGAVAGYFYNEKRIERRAEERVAEIRRAEEKKKLEDLEAARADMIQRQLDQQQKLDEARQYSWERQESARARYNGMVVDRQIQQENFRAQQEQDRQRRMEDMERAREDNAARQRLEAERRRLRSLQCANGPC